MIGIKIEHGSGIGLVEVFIIFPRADENLAA